MAIPMLLHEFLFKKDLKVPKRQKNVKIVLNKMF